MEATPVSQPETLSESTLAHLGLCIKQAASGEVARA